MNADVELDMDTLIVMFWSWQAHDLRSSHDVRISSQLLMMVAGGYPPSLF